MKTLFMSKDLWDLVKDGFVDLIDATEDEAEQLREIKKEARALFLIQRALFL